MTKKIYKKNYKLKKPQKRKSASAQISAFFEKTTKNHILNFEIFRKCQKPEEGYGRPFLGSKKKDTPWPYFSQKL
jgi:hypothetical protein